MKSRSHRLPPSDPPDDWIDGSWTVDCSCGVTFDDGEEMVSCDECGVWVHTRCSRFVKGEASFACHNCKRNNHNNHSSNSSKKPLSAKPSPAAADTEETEVAQLLIELPTKADPCPPPNPFPAPAYHAPFRLWAEVPMEDRVHVQGVPGGEPSLFQGISSSVFTSELWRCAGYVPKKFNFQYREFPCWEEDGAENPASQGADVLFSLSKEIVPSCVPVRAFDRKQEGEKVLPSCVPVRAFDRKQEGEKVLFGSRLQSWGKKERNKLRVFGSQHSSKRRKEEVGEGKDRSGKKKARSDADRVAAEFKKRAGSHLVGEMKKAEPGEDGGLHVVESDALAVKTEERKEDALPEHNLGDRVEGVDGGKKKKARSEADRVVAEFKKRVSLPVADTKKFGLPEDEGVQFAESVVPSQKLEGPSVKSDERKEDVPSQKLEGLSVKNEERKEDVPPQNNASDQAERMANEIMTENDLALEASKEGIADGVPSIKIASSSEVPVKVETEDGTTVILSKGTTGVSPKADVSTASQEKQDDNVKESPKGEDLSKAVHALKQSKGESHFQGDTSSSTQAKMVSSGSCQKNEKMNQPVPQPPSKLLSLAMSMYPPASASAATTLSDEELALLLHQELNSSPRVPRVPRMRQASGMQLTSQIAPSMLSKRSSYSGGKDQVFRRKNKEETSRDGSRNSQDSIDDTKRAGRALSSPDQKYRESSCMADSSSKKDSRNRSPDTTVSMRKNMSGVSTEDENSCQPSFETSGQNVLSIKSSTRDVPDDDTTPRTLPGLIDEILSKCKCLTYEELCDAVRPHWHNVRKPNGDRYAYSSHSHAVLDCLRNRSEWSHLIDRGPKTNSSKRRRKFDSDLPTMEESENEEAKNRASSREVEDKSGDSHREDFPKGKRKARKRRRLELRGRRVEEGKKRKRASSSGSAIVSDDDDNDDDESAAAFSHSSNEGADGIFSEDESQGAVDRAVGAEASASTSSDSSR